MFTTKTRLSALKKYDYMRPAIPYIISGGLLVDKLKMMSSFEGIHRSCKAWSAESMANGANKLREIMEVNAMHRLYPEAICGEKKNDVVLFDFHVKDGAPWVMICAGGAYVSVCSIAEGFPIAARFNELGINAFVLNYRVNEKVLFPHPIDDLAVGIKYVFDNIEKLKVSADYAVCGFSAGGHLVGCWGLKSCGYKAYKLPAPAALMPIYPVVDFTSMPNKAILVLAFGRGYDESQIRQYDVLYNIDREYPPCYIVQCKDDKTVPYANSERLYQKLNGNHIDCKLELGEKGGHGFGEGKGTDVSGWIDRAADFFKSQIAIKEETDRRI